MAVAEIFLPAFITSLFEKLASGELFKLFRAEGPDDKITKWKNYLKMIKAVLNDAEEKQVTNEAVQLWLEDLQDLAYDMDDILDELYTEVSRRIRNHKEPESSTSSKLRKFIPLCCTSFTPSVFMFDRRVSQKIDKITARLDTLAKQNDILGLTKSVGGKLDNVGQGSRATSFVVEETHVLGREKEKAAICKLVLEERKRNNDGVGRSVCVIPILGIGGLGKTTLAQLVYNDEQVKANFDHLAWRLKKFKDLNSVQEGLKKKLSNKKFLIVLDDVWDEDYAKWDRFRVPFLIGAPESAIIVTTRIPRVAKLMGSMKAYDLKLLSDSDCMTLLAQYALQKPNFDRHQDLKETGEAIARKCGGLPLSSKSLGGILRTRKNKEEWQSILNSNIWDIDTPGNDILPALRLSYHHLPPHLKPLFVYCSIFPKDFEFKKDDLILLWMAEGLLNQTVRKKTMEELGLEYFNELLSRFFFQCSSGDKSIFLMHDLINDLALSVAGKVCYRLESNVQPNNSKKVRHSSFIRQQLDTYKKFNPYFETTHLRTFLPTYVGNSYNCFVSNKVLNDLLPALRCLRVLSLSFYVVHEMPRSIVILKHLRYLNMSNTYITKLSASVCELYNLQTLLLRACLRLCQLPKNIGDLANLRHLDIADTPELKEMPASIGMLSSLCTLTKIVIGGGNGFQMTDLKDLSNLKGTLSMFGMQNVGSATEARKANLLGKAGLDNLEMIWNGNFEDCRDEGTEVLVLGALMPQAGLKMLVIENYRGTSFPSWVGHRSFSSMVHLKLSGCKNCISLPTLGNLPSLRELFIEGMDGVKAVGAEFYGDVGGVFPSLETLRFSGMISWEEWCSNSMSGKENGKAVFPKLSKLIMVGCRKLVKACLPRLPSLEVLTMKECSEALVRSLVGFASVKTLEIENIKGLTKLDKGIISSFETIEVLRVSECGELRYLWEEEVACVVLTKLRELVIDGCEELVSFGEKEQVLPCNLEEIKIVECRSLEKIPSCCESLRKLEIRLCQKLNYFTSKKQPAVGGNTENNKATEATESSYSHKKDEMEEEEGFPKLESLEIMFCESMKWLPTGKKRLPSNLKTLFIKECDNLEDTWLLNSSSISISLSVLEDIRIYEWETLKKLPEGGFLGFVYLTSLCIDSCEGIESIAERSLPASLRVLNISYCRNLKSLGLYKEDVKCLEILQIIGCNNLECCPLLGGGGVGGWPPNLKKLTIEGCKNLKSLVLHGNEVECLELLYIKNCKNMEFYLPVGRGGWPHNLKYLTMGEVKQAITEWGLHLHSLPPSLTDFRLEGEFPEMVSLSDVRISIPSSLTFLMISGAVNLKSLSDNDSLQNLTSLEHLWIKNCPKLESLPEMLLPTLSQLSIYRCPLLEKRCSREENGDYWPLISQIPKYFIP